MTSTLDARKQDAELESDGLMSAPPDFRREVYWLLGLPFDAVTLDGAIERLRLAAARRQRCFLSTPNLNFVVTAQNDAAFRDSVLHSDLSVVDGMPLLWIARWLGLPIPERVAGASLFEHLRRSGKAAPLTVYFFGGPDGIAERAAARLNAETMGGIRCVGFVSPGFGSLEAISTPETIAAINASGADFLLVALGARKGQAWIERVLPHLETPIVSHLGAVINFVAGSVERASPRLQRLGLEWLWRIVQEPALWRRYAQDAFGMARLIVTQVLPVWWLQRGAGLTTDAGSLSLVEVANGLDLRLSGAWTASAMPALRQALHTHAARPQKMRVDIGGVTRIDGAFIATMMILRRYRLDRGFGWHIDGASAVLMKMLRAYGAAELVQGQA